MSLIYHYTQYIKGKMTENSEKIFAKIKYWWVLLKSTKDFLKRLFACPKQLDNHENRIRRLEKNKQDLSQIGKVTIAEINTAIDLIICVQEYVVPSDYCGIDYIQAKAEAYRWAKILYYRLRDQKITPSPPDEINNKEIFEKSINKWYEYFLQLRARYKEPS